jgi:hypothetical protein
MVLNGVLTIGAAVSWSTDVDWQCRSPLAAEARLAILLDADTSLQLSDNHPARSFTLSAVQDTDFCARAD